MRVQFAKIIYRFVKRLTKHNSFEQGERESLRNNLTAKCILII